MVRDLGFTVVHEPAEEQVVADVIFIHGLQGHPQRSWSGRRPNASESDAPRTRRLRVPRIFSRSALNNGRTSDTSQEDQVFWPAEVLPKDCPSARILTWGYDSRVSNLIREPTNQNHIFGHAKDLLYALTRERARSNGRRLIFVAHSFGGIILKDVLRRAHGSTDPAISDIFQSTGALLFLGVPHRGSPYTGWAGILSGLARISGFDTNNRNIDALRFDGSELELLREEFVGLWRDGPFKVKTFQEGRGMLPINGLNEKVVPDYSSSLDDPRERAEHINANHMDMCRFTGRDDLGYTQVEGEIRIHLQRAAQC